MTDTGESANPPLVLIGWVKWDGDEFYDFNYTLAGGLPMPPLGYMPVWVKAEDVPVAGRHYPCILSAPCDCGDPIHGASDTGGPT